MPASILLLLLLLLHTSFCCYRESPSPCSVSSSFTFCIFSTTQKGRTVFTTIDHDRPLHHPLSSLLRCASSSSSSSSSSKQAYSLSSLHGSSSCLGASLCAYPRWLCATPHR
uniref:Putative secreted protein n=1 Tax=Anopheles marajoara TaxID=58244 RepID=A0A2M4C8C9_9DIPT